MERLRYLTAIEAARLKEELSTNRDRAIVGVLLHTGMRIGEVVGLQVRDFDTEAKTVRIERIVMKTASIVDRATGQIRLKGFAGRPAYKKDKAISVVLDDGRIQLVKSQDLPVFLKGHTEFVKVGTKAHGDSGRTVPLVDPDTWRYVLAEIQGRPRNEWAWRAGAKSGNHGFAGHAGGRYSYTGARDMVTRAMGRAGIPRDKCHPHTTRHTFAVHFLKNGGDLRSLQRIGGWSNITMVARYLEFVTEDLVDAVKKVDLGF